MKHGAPSPVWRGSFLLGLLALGFTVGCVFVGIVFIKQQKILRELTELRSWCQQHRSLSDTLSDVDLDSSRNQGNLAQLQLVDDPVEGTNSRLRWSTDKARQVEQCRCIPGIKGEQGERGQRGLRGFDGPPGPAGNSGLPGPPGRDGLEGPRGPKGVPGMQRNDGVRGQKGDRGHKGQTGLSGKCRAESCTGHGRTNKEQPTSTTTSIAPTDKQLYLSDGDSYQNFTTGTRYVDGYRGRRQVGSSALVRQKGQKGEKGAPGPQGRNGKAGKTGIPGNTGPRGDKGNKGDQALVNCAMDLLPDPRSLDTSKTKNKLVWRYGSHKGDCVRLDDTELNQWITVQQSGLYYVYGSVGIDWVWLSDLTIDNRSYFPAGFQLKRNDETLAEAKTILNVTVATQKDGKVKIPVVLFAGRLVKLEVNNKLSVVTTLSALINDNPQTFFGLFALTTDDRSKKRPSNSRQ